MATTLYLLPLSIIPQWFSNGGQMASSGTVMTYLAGTTTPVATFTDNTGLINNPNPMTLSSSGRPVSASGAPVAFWVPSGTIVKFVVYDSSGNQLDFLDNLSAINDPADTSSLQSLLASPASSNSTGSGPVAGADLVANAVKSYAVFSSVRAANAPALVTGQTLNIIVQGAMSVGDGLGGNFFWSAASTATDDNRTVLQPSTVIGTAPGRWVRQYPLGVPAVITRTTAQQVVSSTTLVADTVLTASLGVGTYAVSVRLILLGSIATSAGYKIQPTFTAGSAAMLQAGAGVATSNGTAAAIAPVLNSPTVQAAISDVNGDAFNFDMILVVNPAGVFTIEFAQDTSSANPISMQPGSTLTYTRVA
jgi:hypothetical protein